MVPFFVKQTGQGLSRGSVSAVGLKAKLWYNPKLWVLVFGCSIGTVVNGDRILKRIWV